MEKQRHHKSTLSRVALIKAITEQHYEPGNNRRCYKQVWRHYVFPKYGCCYRTFLNYLGIDPEKEEAKEDTGQLSLFSEYPAT